MTLLGYQFQTVVNAMGKWIPHYFNGVRDYYLLQSDNSFQTVLNTVRESNPNSALCYQRTHSK